ncbi:hypothetical protein LR48_Vigan442s008500 [Vigna angularis]|uniref:Uncharacterized protein n=1 Tax=Phaseolus angularis TaxID=3914 RepID=A0A0L9TBZ1_PHAAN|nr:hypothetical protein LR48_Vigan442s008500 [Vigna angularis]
MDDHCIDKTDVQIRTTTQGKNTGPSGLYDSMYLQAFLHPGDVVTGNVHQLPPEISPISPKYSKGLGPPVATGIATGRRSEK